HRSEGFRIEQAERAFEDRAQLVAGLEHVDGMDFHQLLEPLGERRFAAAHWTKQVENLLALLQALRRMAEESHDALDRLFHAMEAGEGRIAAYCPIGKDAAKASVLGRVDHLRFTDRS